jgi:hypothetical protein
VRDFQRQKVYNAESEWRLGMKNQKKEFPVLTLEQLHLKAKEMLVSRQLFDHIQVRDGRGHRRATAFTSRYGWSTLTFPCWSRTLPILVHEVAHVVANRTAVKRVGHGPEFCRSMLRLVRDYISPSEASLLQTYYMKHRVVVSEAQEAFRNRKSRIENFL